MNRNLLVLFLTVVIISCGKKSSSSDGNKKLIADSLNNLETAKIRGIYDAITYDSAVKFRTTYDVQKALENRKAFITDVELVDILPSKNKDSAIVVFAKLSHSKMGTPKYVYFFTNVLIGEELWERVYKCDTVEYKKMVIDVKSVTTAKVNHPSYGLKTVTDYDYSVSGGGRYEDVEYSVDSYDYEVTEFVDYYVTGNLLWISGVEINRYLNKEELRKIYKLVPNILFEQSFDDFYRKMESDFERKYIYELLKERGSIDIDFETFEERLLIKPPTTLIEKMRQNSKIKIEW